jgi:hypothetical protein
MMSESKTDDLDPKARLLRDITTPLPARARIERNSGTELYRQRSDKEMQTPFIKKVASGPQSSQNSRRSANGYMPV